jgi:uncharacterized protein
MDSPKFSGPMGDLFRALPVFIGMALLVTILAMMPGRANNSVSAQTPDNPVQTYPRTVSVSGSGNIQAEPDMAVVVLGVQIEAATAREALTANNEQMDDLIAALRSAGVAQADIKTLSVQLYPRYNDQLPTPVPVDPTPTPTGAAPDAPENRIAGYVASNTVEVTVRNLVNLGQTIDDAITAGGNTVQGIRFDIANQTALLDEAREAAMGDARRKAEQLADLAGAELGVVVSISEFSRTPVMYESAAMDMAQGRSVPVAPGTQTVMLDVQVVWELQ